MVVGRRNEAALATKTTLAKMKMMTKMRVMQTLLLCD
jgi:hypothetical protein